MEDEKLIQEADTFFASSISTTSGVYIVGLGAVGVETRTRRVHQTRRKGRRRKGFNWVMVRYVRSQRMHWLSSGAPTVLYRNGSLQVVNHK